MWGVERGWKKFVDKLLIASVDQLVNEKSELYENHKTCVSEIQNLQQASSEYRAKATSLEDRVCSLTKELTICRDELAKLHLDRHEAQDDKLNSQVALTEAYDETNILKSKIIQLQECITNRDMHSQQILQRFENDQMVSTSSHSNFFSTVVYEGTLSPTDRIGDW